MSDEETPTHEDLQKLRVVDLKKELERLDLSTTGVKAVLVQRIFDYYQEQADAKDEESTGDDESSAAPSAEQSVEPSPAQSKEPSPEPALVEEPETEPAAAIEESEPEDVEDPEPEPAAAVEELEPENAMEEEPTQDPEPEKTKEPTPEPAKEPSPEPMPMRDPTPEPAREPTPEPMKEPSPEPAAEPSSEPKPKLSMSFGPPQVHPAGAPPADVPRPAPAAAVVEEYYGGDEYGGGGGDNEYGGGDDDEYGGGDAADEESEKENVGDGEVVKSKKEKNQRKKQKKKKKKNRPEQWALQAVAEHRRRMEEEQKKSQQEVEVEYIQEQLDLAPTDPMFRTFNKIFQAFKIVEETKKDDEDQAEKEEEERKMAEELKKVPKLAEDDDMVEPDDIGGDGSAKISKRKLKKLSRLSVAELKQLVSRPDVVEMHDVTARDPRLLVHLKSTRNTVPVPRHWCFKRKYLQGKRGIEKPPFDLPDFIKKTGIMEMREALQEKEDAKGMKAKMREKVRPKLGKIDIDYQKLHDAFFKWQTKPKMSMHGDLYYEGKEFEIRLKEKKPGDLSDDLRTALGMPVGPNAHKVPAPWLIAMQRYGPPPSYPNLKIAGLNAPIPDGCSFGYHAGGWGKPPVDEQGKPLYGDVFGTSDTKQFPTQTPEEIDQTLWGEMESESEEETDSEEEDDEDEDEAGETSGLQTPVVDPGLATPSGTTSVGGAGLETPDMIELRKRRIEADMEGGETPSLPYTVIPERANQRIGGSMMGSTHTYDMKTAGGRAGAAAAAAAAGAKDGKSAAVEMALNPEDIDDMDSETMALRAEAALREQQANLAKEDLSDMVAEHAAKQKNKRKRQEQKDEKEKNKKYKEFKF